LERALLPVDHSHERVHSGHIAKRRMYKRPFIIEQARLLITFVD
jgi:hypothetical protein